MDNYMELIVTEEPIFFGTFFGIILILAIIVIIFIALKNSFYKTSKKNNDIDTDIDTESKDTLKYTTSFNIHTSKEALNFLDKLIEDKYQFYLYKEILPLYVGSENKKEKFTKDNFLKIKEKFFNDVVFSLSSFLKKELSYLLSEQGFIIYIHQRFSTLFNKTDARFLNQEEDIKENMFFMSEIFDNKNTKTKKD